jgi:hypothetical protein
MAVGAAGTADRMRAMVSAEAVAMKDEGRIGGAISASSSSVSIP